MQHALALAATLACWCPAPAAQESAERGIGVERLEGVASPGYANRHALVVGIDDYSDPEFQDLGYAVADARAFAEVLIKSYGFAQENVMLLLDEDATKVALDQALEDWACDVDRVGEEDLFVLFFAGHGDTRPGRRGDRGYLVPTDAERDTWSTLLDMGDLEGISELVPAKHALFILDCCFGGLAVNRSAPPVAAGLTNRARQVITAGNAQQAVLDTGGGGHSVFTRALLDALAGDADLDADGVVTYGELANHVATEVERKTERRQTPLRSEFPDHEGGSVALFPPGVRPGGMTAAQRLKALERSLEEQLAELRRMADVVLAMDLTEEAGDLWPQFPEMVPAYRDWLSRTRELSTRRSDHEESVRRVRQEVHLSQVVAGLVDEGARTEPLWEVAEPELRWRFETFTKLVESLGALEGVAADIEWRLEFASTVEERTVSGGHVAALWAEAIRSVAELEVYRGLELSPQLGLVPLGRDRESGLWEFGDVQTGEPPERDRSGRLVLTEETGLVFVLLPGGDFLMGAQREDPTQPNYDPDAQEDEGPVHEATSPPFFISKYEMTQGHWKRLTGSNPSVYGAEGLWSTNWSADGRTASLLLPVEHVDWNACVDTLDRLRLQLPSEAQWEYAARGGMGSPWWTGETKETLAGAANLMDRSARRLGRSSWSGVEEWLEDGYAVHAPVNTLWANDFGLHHVHGNVWEWCADEYDQHSYRDRELDDPVGAGMAPFCVNRGGAFDDPAGNARSARRYGNAPSFTDGNLGLRPARAITN